MSDINEGGPAFPLEFHNSTGGNILVAGAVVPSGGTATCLGMTLRDYFAAKALMGMISCNVNNDYEDEKLRREDYRAYCDNFAESSYQMADAMLAARSK